MKYVCFDRIEYYNFFYKFALEGEVLDIKKLKNRFVF